MRVLLDTHVLIWALAEPRKLARDVLLIKGAPENEILFSAASIWEIAIKTQIGWIDFPVQPNEIAQAAADSGFTELPIRAASAALVARLPLYHRDPFDRLLIAQAMSEPARFFTVDPKSATELFWHEKTSLSE